MPKASTILSAATHGIIRLVERQHRVDLAQRGMPAVHRREWAALAIEAARMGNLPPEQLKELRCWFDAEDAEDAAKGGVR